jgi:putative FmdB family regulatory protein
MPTYEYKCEACGNVFEKFQSITAPAIKKCSKCGKNKAKRLIGTGAAMIFKGGGFYITDYRSEAYKDSAKADKAPAATDGKAPPEKGGTETTVKPAADTPAPQAKPAAESSKTSSETKPTKSPSKSGKKND